MTQSIKLSALKNLQTMIGGDPDDLAELVDDFVSGLPVQVQQMQFYGDAGDMAALRIVAHSCKSNARDFGASHLSDLCAQLETQSAAGQVEDLPAFLVNIAEAAETALSEFARLDLAGI